MGIALFRFVIYARERLNDYRLTTMDLIQIFIIFFSINCVLKAITIKTFRRLFQNQSRCNTVKLELKLEYQRRSNCDCNAQNSS